MLWPLRDDQTAAAAAAAAASRPVGRGGAGSRTMGRGVTAEQGTSWTAPLCERCGGTRVFECQLMPPLHTCLATHLRTTHNNNDAAAAATDGSAAADAQIAASLRAGGPGMCEWLTVAVYVCERCCGRADGDHTYALEVARVAFEE